MKLELKLNDPLVVRKKRDENKDDSSIGHTSPNPPLLGYVIFFPGTDMPALPTVVLPITPLVWIFILIVSHHAAARVLVSELLALLIAVTTCVGRAVRNLPTYGRWDDIFIVVCTWLDTYSVMAIR